MTRARAAHSYHEVERHNAETSCIKCGAATPHVCEWCGACSPCHKGASIERRY